MQEIMAKALVFGDSGVGKSCIVERLEGGEFKPETKSTIGAEFVIKKMKFGKQLITFEIWDTPGQKQFSTLGNDYYLESDAAIVVMDGTDSYKPENVQAWVEGVKEKCVGNIEFYFVINKCDSDLHPDFAEVDEICNKLFNLVSDVVTENNKEGFKEKHVLYTSAKANTNLDVLLEQIGNDIINNLNNRDKICNKLFNLVSDVEAEDTSEAEAPQKPVLTFRERLEAYTSPLNWIGAFFKMIFSGFQFMLSWRKLWLAKELLAQVTNAEDKIQDEQERNCKYRGLIATYGVRNLDLVRGEYGRSWFFKKNYGEVDLNQTDQFIGNEGELGKILMDTMVTISRNAIPR